MLRLDINKSPIYDIFYNGDRISQVFYNGESIYRASAYPPHTALLNEATAGTYEFHFKKGRYYIALTGAGGQASGGYYYFCFQNSGGSGGTIVGDFYVNNECDATITVGAGQGGKGGVSTLSVDSTQMMYADGGNYCHANGGCGGNTGGSNNSFSLSGNLSNISLSAIAGNNGVYDLNQAQGAYSNDPISNTRGRGATSSACSVQIGNAGGVYIEYISG